ncbi:hypothetical protein YC2023_076208 [Brassica napus]
MSRRRRGWVTIHTLMSNKTVSQKAIGGSRNQTGSLASEASCHEGFSNMVVTHEEEAAKTQLVSIKEDLVVRALDHNKKRPALPLTRFKSTNQATSALSQSQDITQIAIPSLHPSHPFSQIQVIYEEIRIIQRGFRNHKHVKSRDRL